MIFTPLPTLLGKARIDALQPPKGKGYMDISFQYDFSEIFNKINELLMSKIGAKNLRHHGENPIPFKPPIEFFYGMAEMFRSIDFLHEHHYPDTPLFARDLQALYEPPPPVYNSVFRLIARIEFEMAPFITVSWKDIEDRAIELESIYGDLIMPQPNYDREKMKYVLESPGIDFFKSMIYMRLAQYMMYYLYDANVMSDRILGIGDLARKLETMYLETDPIYDSEGHMDDRYALLGQGIIDNTGHKMKYDYNFDRIYIRIEDMLHERIGRYYIDNKNYRDMRQDWDGIRFGRLMYGIAHMILAVTNSLGPRLRPDNNLLGDVMERYRIPGLIARSDVPNMIQNDIAHMERIIRRDQEERVRLEDTIRRRGNPDELDIGSHGSSSRKSRSFGSFSSRSNRSARSPSSPIVENAEAAPRQPLLTAEDVGDILDLQPPGIEIIDEDRGGPSSPPRFGRGRREHPLVTRYSTHR